VSKKVEKFKAMKLKVLARQSLHLEEEQTISKMELVPPIQNVTQTTLKKLPVKPFIITIPNLWNGFTNDGDSKTQASAPTTVGRQIREFPVKKFCSE
jgi:hypothetical protein